jgi:hypothetical protein
MKTENMGWQCPNCLVVYAPSIQRCECSVVLNQTNPLPKDYISFSGFGNTTTGTITMCSGYISETKDGICSKCGNPKWNHPIYT